MKVIIDNEEWVKAESVIKSLEEYLIYAKSAKYDEPYIIDLIKELKEVKE